MENEQVRSSPIINNPSQGINVSEQERQIPKNLSVTPELVLEWKNWITAQGYSLDSVLSYFSFIKKFVDYGNVMEQRNIDKFLEIEKNNNTVSIAALKSFINFLVKKKNFPVTLQTLYFERNRKSSKLRLPKTISYEEFQILYSSVPSLADKILTQLIYELALRISEAIKLKWEDFNWLEWINNKANFGTVRLKNTKGGKFRVLPVKPELMSLLYDAHKNRSSLGVPIGGLVFDKGFLSYMKNEKSREEEQHDYKDYFKRGYRRLLNNLSRAHLNKRISPHMLRHSKAQTLRDRGMPLDSLQIFLGHSNISTTEIYARASPETIKQDLIIYDRPKEP